MKLFDCTLYYDEDLILEARLNILSKYFDKFIICEAKYTHSVRANIHGLEDMNLTPPIDCDFLNVLLEMPTSEQRQVIEKA